MDSVIGHYMVCESVDLSQSACARMSKPIRLLACTGAHIHPFVCTLTQLLHPAAACPSFLN